MFLKLSLLNILFTQKYSWFHIALFSFFISSFFSLLVLHIQDHIFHIPHFKDTAQFIPQITKTPQELCFSSLLTVEMKNNKR